MIARSSSSRRHALVIGINSYPGFPAENQLAGCVNDAHLMAGVLEERFGFPEPRLLLEEEATREGILVALDELIQKSAPGDFVTVHYSGHGSQMRDREGDEPDGYDETIVPFDSGRRPHPNRDISDDEIHAWLLRLTQRTPHVTLIFDACHSATISRDPFGTACRGVPADRRPLTELPPSSLGVSRSRSTLRGDGPSGWLPLAELGEHYLLIAACRDEEFAFEHRPEEGADHVHGALTFFLCRELLAARPGDSYRDVFERLAPRLTGSYPRQHPQLEGARDRLLFGVSDLQARRLIRIRERADGRTLLAAGAALRLCRDTELAVYPPEVREVTAATSRLGRLRVHEVGAVTARAEITEEASPGAVAAGCWALVTGDNYGEMRLAVELPEPTDADAEIAELHRQVTASPLLRSADGHPGRLRVYRLTPRTEVRPDDPVPMLASISEPLWVIVGEDGVLAMPPSPAGEPGTVARLVHDLELRARFVQTLALENRDPESALAGYVDLQLRQQIQDGSWGPLTAEEGGTPFCEEGVRLGLEIHNDWRREIYVAVLDFGLTGRISLVHPVPGAEEPIPPGGILRIGMRTGGAVFRVGFPSGFPFDGIATSDRRGSEWIKLFATTHPADFSPLQQKPWREARAASPPIRVSPLSRLLRLAATGQGARGPVPIQESRAEDWTTLTRHFEVRPAAGQPFPG